MVISSILRQLQKEKKQLLAATLLLLGIGIIRLSTLGPKSTKTVGLSSIPQAIHRAFDSGLSALLPDNAPIGIVPPDGRTTGPDEEAGAYFIAKVPPGVPAKNVFAAAGAASDLSAGDERDLLAKI